MGIVITILITFYDRAVKIRSSTPHSFKELPDLKLIFSPEFLNHPKEKLISDLERLENLPCLPILAEELFFYSYPDILSCSNPKCLNSLNSFKQLNNSEIQISN